MARLDQMYELRKNAAAFYRGLGLEQQTPNGDESDFADLRGNFSKGLPHDANTGLVDVTKWKALFGDLSQLGTGTPGQAPFVDPQAGTAFDTQGPDAEQLALSAPPKFESDTEIAEIAENYWMALLRDVPFADYSSSQPLVNQAVAHLQTFPTYAQVTPETLFRGPLQGDGAGPLLSQFMVWDVPYGSQKLANQVAFALPDNRDYLTDWTNWITVENGTVSRQPVIGPVTPRYMRSGRDVSQYVHIDELFQAYLNACLILITPKPRGGFAALADEGNPYTGADPSKHPPAPKQMTQVGFGTLGEPNYKTLVAEVATRALRQVWYQKWFVHRRLRPEEFGGRLEAQRRQQMDFVSAPHLQQLMPVLALVEAKYGSWLLPQAFPEGCPVHPAYGAGHATVAGACVTVLKALFYEGSLLKDLGIVPQTIDADGNRVPYTGSDKDELTVLGELNKLASNVGLARNIAGVHWRTDYTRSVVLGERVALYFLQEYIRCYSEHHVSFHVTKFNGDEVVITKTSAHHFPDYELPAATPTLVHA